MKRSLLAVGLTVMMMFLVAPGAQAALFDITSQHFDAGPAGTIFGTVNVVQDGTSVDFTVTLNNGSLFVRTGAGAFENFLFNGTGIVVGDITGTGITADAGAPLLHADGTGDWMFGVRFTAQTDTGGGSGLPGPLTFSVANATIADVIGGNGSNIFAIDILSGYTGLTGMVDVSTPPVPAVPEPGTMLLLGSGLVGLAGWGRKKFRK